MSQDATVRDQLAEYLHGYEPGNGHDYGYALAEHMATAALQWMSEQGYVAAHQAIHLLTGDVPEHAEPGNEETGSVGPLTGRLLVTVWGDGTGEVAWRSTDDTRESWGPPSALTPAP